jgi:hypothetical protein
MTFVDPVNPDHSVVLTNMFVNAGYTVPRNETLAQTSFSKQKFVAAVGTPIMTQIDAEGNTLEKWSLNNAFFTSIDYGQLDYSSEELIILSVTLRYDYATLDVSDASTPQSLLPSGEI